MDETWFTSSFTWTIHIRLGIRADPYDHNYILHWHITVLPFLKKNIISRPEPHLDPHRGWCQRAEFLGHALTDAREHGGATREHHVAEEITANVHVALPEICFCCEIPRKNQHIVCFCMLFQISQFIYTYMSIEQFICNINRLEYSNVLRILNGSIVERCRTSIYVFDNIWNKENQ